MKKLYELDKDLVGIRVKHKALYSALAVFTFGLILSFIFQGKITFQFIFVAIAFSMAMYSRKIFYGNLIDKNDIYQTLEVTTEQLILSGEDARSIINLSNIKESKFIKKSLLKD